MSKAKCFRRKGDHCYRLLLLFDISSENPVTPILIFQQEDLTRVVCRGLLDSATCKIKKALMHIV